MELLFLELLLFEPVISLELFKPLLVFHPELMLPVISLFLDFPLSSLDISQRILRLGGIWNLPRCKVLIDFLHLIERVDG